MKNIKLKRRSFWSMVNVIVFVFMHCGNRVDNLKKIFKSLSSLFCKFSQKTFELSYCNSKENLFFEFLAKNGYTYNYLTENGTVYSSYLESDAEIYWGFRAIPKREVGMNFSQDQDKDSITEVFGETIPCLNINLPYVKHKSIRVNLGHESKKDLLVLLDKFELGSVLCKIYYHATLSYVFSTNTLIDIRKAEQDEDLLWDKVYTYVADIPNVKDFIDQYYEKIIDDSSVFRVGNIVFGFYDSGVNILSLENNGITVIMNNIELLGYTWNKRGFYENSGRSRL